LVWETAFGHGGAGTGEGDDKDNLSGALCRLTGQDGAKDSKGWKGTEEGSPRYEWGRRRGGGGRVCPVSRIGAFSGKGLKEGGARQHGCEVVFLEGSRAETGKTVF